MAGVPPAKVRYGHQAIADLMITHPGMSQNEIAAYVGVTPAWLSTVVCSDLFQQYYRERRAEYETGLNDAVRDRLAVTTLNALDKLNEVLDVPLEELDPRIVVDAADKLLRSGIGAQAKAAHIAPLVLNGPTVINQNILAAAREAREKHLNAASQSSVGEAKVEGTPLLAAPESAV